MGRTGAVALCQRMIIQRPAHCRILVYSPSGNLIGDLKVPQCSTLAGIRFQIDRAKNARPGSGGMYTGAFCSGSPQPLLGKAVLIIKLEHGPAAAPAVLTLKSSASAPANTTSTLKQAVEQRRCDKAQPSHLRRLRDQRVAAASRVAMEPGMTFARSDINALSDASAALQHAVLACGSLSADALRQLDSVPDKLSTFAKHVVRERVDAAGVRGGVSRGQRQDQPTEGGGA